MWKTKSDRDQTKRKLEAALLTQQNLELRLHQTSSARLSETADLKRSLSDKDAAVLNLTLYCKNSEFELDQLRIKMKDLERRLLLKNNEVSFYSIQNINY